MLGGPNVPGSKATGWVYTDDEAHNNNNNNTVVNSTNADLSAILSTGTNTKLFTVRVE